MTFALHIPPWLFDFGLGFLCGAIVAGVGVWIWINVSLQNAIRRSFGW